MKHLWKRMGICAVLLILAMGGAAGVSAASDSDSAQQTTQEMYDEQLEASGAQDLWDDLSPETRQLLESIGLTGLQYSSFQQVTPQNVLEGTGKLLSEKSALPLKAGAAILGIIVLCALMDGLKNTVDQSSMTGVYGAICALASSAAVILPMVGCIDRVTAAVKSTSVFMGSYVPVYVAVLITGGQTFTATAYQTIVLFASEMMSYLITTVVVPLMTITLAVGLAGSVSPTLRLQSIGDFSCNIATWLLAGAATLFVGLLSLQGIVGGAADTLANRAVKFSLSSFVPVVGSALSEAYNSVKGCVGLLKSTIGGFGMLTTGLIVLPPLLESIVWAAVLCFCKMAADVFGLEPVSGILKVAQSVVKMMIAVLCSCGLVLIIATAIVTKAGAA